MLTRQQAGSEAGGLRRANNATAAAPRCPIERLTNGLVEQVVQLLCGEDLHNARLAWRRFDAASRAAGTQEINVAGASESGPPNWARFPQLKELRLHCFRNVEPSALRAVLSDGGGDAAAAAAASAAQLAAIEKLSLESISNKHIVPTLECALSRMPRITTLVLNCCRDGVLDASLARSLVSMTSHMAHVYLAFNAVRSAALPILGRVKCAGLRCLRGPSATDNVVITPWKDTLQRFVIAGATVREVPCLMPNLTRLAPLELRPSGETLHTLATNLPNLQGVRVKVLGNWAGMQRRRFTPFASVKRAQVCADEESCGVPLARLIPNVQALGFNLRGRHGLDLPSLAGLTALRTLVLFDWILEKPEAEAIVASAPQLTALVFQITRRHFPAIGVLSGLRGLTSLDVDVDEDEEGDSLPVGLADVLLAVTALTSLTFLELATLDYIQDEEEETKRPSMWEAVCGLLVARMPLRTLQVCDGLAPEEIRALAALPTLRRLYVLGNCGVLTPISLRGEDIEATAEAPVSLPGCVTFR